MFYTRREVVSIELEALVMLFYQLETKPSSAIEIPSALQFEDIYVFHSSTLVGRFSVERKFHIHHKGISMLHRNLVYNLVKTPSMFCLKWYTTLRGIPSGLRVEALFFSASRPNRVGPLSVERKFKFITGIPLKNVSKPNLESFQ